MSTVSRLQSSLIRLPLKLSFPSRSYRASISSTQQQRRVSTSARGLATLHRPVVPSARVSAFYKAAQRPLPSTNSACGSRAPRSVPEAVKFTSEQTVSFTSGRAVRFNSGSTPGSPAGMEFTAEARRRLEKYSACDIADALLKLEKVEGGRATAGFLDGIEPIIPSSPTSAPSKPLIAPAFTVQFQPKDNSAPQSKPHHLSCNIPKGLQWSDLVPTGSIVVVQQPLGQKCAAVGGIHALRTYMLGTRGLLVAGRVRDTAEMGELKGFEVWSQGKSIVGAGAECKPWNVGTEVEIGEVLVRTGDVIFLDGVEGAVRIPKDLVEEVLSYLWEKTPGEEKIKEEVGKGMSVGQAFEKFR